MQAIARLVSPAAAFALLLGFGLAVLAVIGGALVYPDEREYLTIAIWLRESGLYSLDGATPTAYRPPGYPLILAALMTLSDSVWWLKAANVVAWAVTGVLTAAVAQSLYGAAARPWAVLLFMTYLVGPYTATTLYPQTMAGALLMLSVLCVARRDAAPASAATVALGAQGAAVLLVPTFILTLPLFVLPFLGTPRGRRGVVLGLAIAAALVAPWAVRNAVVFDRFIPLSTTGGLNLLLGNSPLTTANSGVNVDLDAVAPGAPADELARDDHFARAARDWIAEHPLTAARLYLQKFVHWFAYRNDLATAVAGVEWKSLLVAATYYPILVLAVLACVVAIRDGSWRRAWFLPALYLAAAAAYAIFFTRIRFRVPFDSLLMVLAAGWLSARLSVAPRQLESLDLT